ncbi:MAG: hypothetical protein K9K66_14975 [Desulfarculaceae bacterium]|nr:hypothetical protein [Desulfarculaceae bacterium]MCF8072496.1 hypothetical protein [Desulfarculaceae bacterium]MCF8102957.1 hypothetical protein [Desulfarculaceae bacterium]MCF8117037.1 hypothetical protein [Desulfarculaceae bacterium]
MRRFAVAMLALALWLAPAPALAAEWQGSIQGLGCVTKGLVCPINMEDPLIALEKNFVLLIKDGEFYHLPNLDRAILARHLNRPVKVVGELLPGSKSIMVEHLYLSKNGQWRESWSPEMERELIEQLQSWGKKKKEE